MSSYPLDDYYTFGDVFETIEACHELERLLSRLRRQRLLDDHSWMSSKRDLAEIVRRLENQISAAS